MKPAPPVDLVEELRRSLEEPGRRGLAPPPDAELNQIAQAVASGLPAPAKNLTGPTAPEASLGATAAPAPPTEAPAQPTLLHDADLVDISHAAPAAAPARPRAPRKPLVYAPSPAERALALEGSDDQFRLERIQVFNWGTFSQLVDFPVPRAGYLFVGNSGSGKSTVLDAHAALLTPPRWVEFNVAAREADKQTKDRNLMTYVRGAWGEQTGKEGEFVAQLLRPGTTWSAIAETYRSPRGQVVVLVMVMWVVGTTMSPRDVKHRYLVLQEDFDIADLEFFAASQFDVRTFRTRLPQAAVYEQFSGYQERFRDLLGIDSERALRLLHKTQSAKNLGDLNTFMREFMLERPETFDVAQNLVVEFGDLDSAHQAVVEAGLQIDALTPAQSAFQEREQAHLRCNELREILAGMPLYREHRRAQLYEALRQEKQTDLEGERQRLQGLEAALGREEDVLRDLVERRKELGGNRLENLIRERAEAEALKPERVRKREVARAAMDVMGWAMPDEVVSFVQRTEAAKERVHRSHERAVELRSQRDELVRNLGNSRDEFAKLVREVRSMEKRRSNIPAGLLDARADMAKALDLAESDLPFAGELLEVKPEESAWQGAIERALGGFARSILVDDEDYARVSDYLNRNNTGERLLYNRVLPRAATNRSVGPQSLVRKLNIAPSPFQDWLREELRDSFDFECTTDMLVFRRSMKALTQAGQLKRDSTRHEKNDRFRVDDRTQWVLGFDNLAKLALYKTQAADLGAAIGELEEKLREVEADQDKQQRQDQACATLKDMTWNEVDVGELIERVKDYDRRIAAEQQSNPDLARLDVDIAGQTVVRDKARKADQDCRTAIAVLEREIQGVAEALRKLEGRVQPTPTQAQAIEERLSRRLVEVTLDNLADAMDTVRAFYSGENQRLELRMMELQSGIESAFKEFNRLWPAKAAGLDPVLASAPDYFAKLESLVADGLPAFEERFRKLLHEQSDQNLTLLQSKLDAERSTIRSRLDLVNSSLLTAPFNPGTHIVIESNDRSLEDVRQFRLQLKEALSHSFGNDRQENERRFAALRALVMRLGSQETADLNWRNLVLDVRFHVDFVARELDTATGAEVEVYRSGAGKSGGQRQKLTATCLAAALRYQLGGQDRALPVFSTVVLDEAFDKADSDFTAASMNIFKTFGFQMVVATPMKSVMTLEPFIGGACYVENRDRKTSSVLRIDYDEATGRLKLPEHAHDDDEKTAAA